MTIVRKFGKRGKRFVKPLETAPPYPDRLHFGQPCRLSKSSFRSMP